MVALVVDPASPNNVYVGTFSKGVFKSTNGGASWEAINNGLNGTIPNILRIDPSNGNVIYAARERRLFKTTNGGANWTELALPSGFIIRGVVIDPSNANTIYAPGIGIVKTTNGGATWTSIEAGLDDRNVNDFVIDPSKKDVVYTATRQGGVFISTNGGQKWKQVNQGIQGLIVLVIAIDPSNPEIVYAGTTASSIFKREFKLPQIQSAVFTAPKNLTISGRNFGSSPRVIINGKDRSDFVTSVSDTSIQLKGKAKKLKIKSGDNTLQVIITDGTESNVFTLKF